MRNSHRRAHERDGCLDVSRHQRRIHAEYTTTIPREHRIPVRIRASLLIVMTAIDLDHQPLSGRQKVQR